MTLVEYGDFQCPFCARAQPTLTRLRELYGDRLRLAFRHRPLPFHEHAQRAAEAAIAAQQQGKFWELHDKLYGIFSSELSDDAIAQAARDVGLDMAKFAAAMRDHTYKPLLDHELAHAADVKVDGTPTFFVNGRMIVGAQPLEKFRAVIDDELRTVDELVRLGVPPDRLYDARLATTVGVEEPPAAHAPDPPRPARVAAWTPIIGPKLAKVTIVEYSDLQCPFCARAAATMKRLRDKYGSDLRIAYRHNPLPFHPRARELSRMAMAAHAQGKFWEMQEYLFEHQQDLPSDEDGVSVARTLGLDIVRYKRDLSSVETARHIDEDVAEAAKLGATGTPTFFVNGQPVEGAQPIQVFEKVIEEERAKAQALLDAGVALPALYDKIMETLAQEAR